MIWNSTYSSNACVAEPEACVSEPMAAGRTLLAVGAIARLAGEREPVLVGDLQWLKGPTLLIFIAHGEAPVDARVLRFNEARVNETRRITFLSGGDVAGVIERIEDAAVPDPDDYRVAWALWQEVAHLRRPLIQRCYRAIAGDLLAGQA